METPNDSNGVVGTISSDPLPTTRDVTVVEQFTLEERITRMETVLRDFITNPPKLPDAEILSNRIASVDGKVSAALAQIAAISEIIPDRMDRVEQRCMTVDQHVQRIADEKGVQLAAVVHDPEHQTAQTARTFTCPACGTGFSDVVMTAAVNSAQKPCPTCGRAVTFASACAHKSEAA